MRKEKNKELLEEKESLEEILTNPFNPEFYIIKSLYYYGNTVLSSDFIEQYGIEEIERVLSKIMETPASIRIAKNTYHIVEINHLGIPKKGKANELIEMLA